MRWFRLVPLVFLAVVAAACADTGPASPTRVSDASASATASCAATLSGLLGQARDLYGKDAPNYNSVRGRLENLAFFLNHKNPKQREQAKLRAHDIVDFTLEQQAAGRLSGTDEAIAKFINEVYCFAGIEIIVEDPDDTWFIYPTDLPQTLFGLDSSVGVSLPGNPVNEPSLLRIERFEGRLNTELDQYPGFVRITLLSENSLGLAGRATITVCATDLPEDLDLDDLRLGHGIQDTGFVVTPLPTGADPAPADVLCEEESLSLAARVWRSVRDAVTPQALHASTSAMRRLKGGVSGTVTEFSPFAPVDAELSIGGGVSGTVTEFREASAMPTGIALSTTESCVERWSLGLLPSECFPVLSVRTRSGTVLEGVPVDWTIPKKSPGTVAPRSGDAGAITCGTLATATTTFTTPLGNTGICWRMHSAGVHQVVARPRAGGEAPAGVTFSADGADSVLFEVLVKLAGVATDIAIVEGAGQSAPAGTTTPIAPRVLVTDAFGSPVVGAAVTWAVRTGTGSVASATTTTGADGTASVAWTLGLGANDLQASFTSHIFGRVVFSATGTAP